jgi:hypothetical protein
MDGIQIKVDASQVERLGNLLGAAGAKAPQAVRHALNHTGAKARNAMVKALVPQTGLKQKVLKKALKGSKAYRGGASAKWGGAGSDAYIIKSKGGNIALKYFRAREKGDGVDASPWNGQRHYTRGFARMGWKPHRYKTWAFHGNVMRRKGEGKHPLTLVKSGLDIPDEMVSGASRTAFFAVAQTDLMPRLFHELLRVIPG